MANDIITIKEATQKQAGPSIKFSYVDTNGGHWCTWEPLQLVAGKTYELQKIETKKWSSKQNPDREFTDYVIKQAKEVAPGLNQPATKSVAQQPAQPQANGHAAPANGDKDRAILTAVLAKFVAPIPFSDRLTMANQMTEIYLAAQDACDRIVE